MASIVASSIEVKRKVRTVVSVRRIGAQTFANLEPDTRLILRAVVERTRLMAMPVGLPG